MSEQTAAPQQSAPPTNQESIPVSSAAPVEDSRLAQIAKKEAAFQKERETFKREQAAIAEEKKKIAEIHAQIQRFEDLRKKDKLAAFKEIGFTETDLFEALAGVPEPTPEQKTQKLVQEELDKFKKSQEEAAAAAQADADKRVIANFKAQIDQSIEKQSSKYEFLAYNKEAARDIVYDLMAQDYANSGQLMSLSEAMDIVETYYENEYKEMSQKVSKLKPKETAPAADPATTPLADAAAKRPTVSPQPFSETREQKRARLIAQIKQTGFKKS